jgi:hypothetical protein
LLTIWPLVGRVHRDAIVAIAASAAAGGSP